MNRSEMIEKLSEYLPEKRIIHSISVAKTAVKLSEIYDCCMEKAEIAGILHDTAKYFKLADIPDYCDKYSIELDELEKKSTALSHSILGAYIAKYDFGVDDEDILNAIRFHTTGRPNMTKLEEIVFMADLIEDGRNYPGVDELRQLAFDGKMDEAIVKSIENTIIQVIRKKSVLHTRTVDARNYYLKKIKELGKIKE